MKKLFLGLFFALFSQVVLSVGNPVTVYSNAPIYLPSNQSATASIASTAAPGYFGPYQVYASDSVARINVTGTFTGLVMTAFITSDSGQSTQVLQFSNYNWSPVSFSSVNGQRALSVTGTGIYSIDVSGASSFYLSVSSLSTGTVSVSISEGLGAAPLTTYKQNKATYHADFGGAAGLAASSTTDNVGICGSATKTVAVTHFEVSGINSTASVVKNVGLILRSTADTAGTPATVSSVSSDSTDPAATATVKSYTGTGPTVGTAIGGIVTGALSIPLATATGSNFFTEDFGPQSRNFSKEIFLRGVAQCLYLNLNGASANSTLYGGIEWTEY